jgi:hypothetical protein
MTSRQWGYLVMAFGVAAVLCALAAIWFYDWRWGATGGVAAASAWMAVIGTIFASRS